MLPVISRHTRFSTESSTLIDNICINKPNESLKSGILLCDITDHLPIFYISPTGIKDTLPNYVTISTKSITDDNILKFKDALQSSDWSDINGSVSADQPYQTIYNKYLKIFEQIMHIMQRKVKAYSNLNKPWIRSGILKSI